MTMLEKAAHALAMAHYSNRFPAGPEEHWRNNADVNRHLFVEQARAVLAAIREPDEAMLDAVGCGGVFRTGIAGLAWSQSFGAMIDAILAGREK